jgi:hypothetical protein
VNEPFVLHLRSANRAHHRPFHLEHFDLVSQAEAHGRIVTVDAAVACSTNCLATYLTTELEPA